MNLSFEFKTSQLNVFSAVCSNLVVFWIAAIFATRDIFVLTGDIIGVILSWKLAVKAEDLLEDYD